jgi:hypothetical protein
VYAFLAVYVLVVDLLVGIRVLVISAKHELLLPGYYGYL